MPQAARPGPGPLTAVLWTARDAAAATGGRTLGEWQARGVSIDSRTLAPGDLFVALQGPIHDGHDFVADAFARGAAAALVEHSVPGLPAGAPLLYVADALTALTALGTAARRRSRARIVAVTGSVGKTGTKEALRVALSACGTTAAAAGSLNNHWGVPLSLARIPEDAVFAVFEIGMNHPGEIAPLSRLVRPHVAVITTVEPVHLGFFDSVAAIAAAKAEIFEGLEPGGSAILNRDNPQYPSLEAAAERAGARVVSFGVERSATVRLLACTTDPEGSAIEAALPSGRVPYRLPLPGRHWVINSLAVLAAAEAAGADPARAAAALEALEAPAGRGRRHDLPWRGGRLTLFDESYNASPPSMRAALAVIATTSIGPDGRRVAVLGEMRELGDSAERLHRELAEPIVAAGIDRVFLIGPAMAALYAALPQARRGGLWPTVDAAIPSLLSYLRPGDAVTVKGSYAVHTTRIVERLCAESARLET